MPEFQDRVLKCVDCGADFVFTAGEQHFFHDKNFKNEPKRCKACKTKRQGGRRRVQQDRNHDHVLAMRPGNHGAFQAHAGPAGLLPRVLPEPQGRGAVGIGGRVRSPRRNREKLGSAGCPMAKSPVWKLAAIAVLAVLVHGYQLGVDDSAIYVPAVKRMADPSLYPFGSQFFLTHAHLSIFAAVVGLPAR